MNKFLRNFLNIRQTRRAPPIGGLPTVGSPVIRGNMRINVNEKISPELWTWMVLSGWRNVAVKVDRRSYIQLPENFLKTLIDAAPTERDIVHARMIEWGAAGQRRE